MKSKLILFITGALFASLANGAPILYGEDLHQNDACQFTILTRSPEQQILHFGASDAWSMQFLGLWPEKQQEQIADWLFST